MMRTQIATLLAGGLLALLVGCSTFGTAARETGDAAAKTAEAAGDAAGTAARETGDAIDRTAEEAEDEID